MVPRACSLSPLTLFIVSRAFHGTVWALLFFEFQISDKLSMANSGCSFFLLETRHFTFPQFTIIHAFIYFLIYSFVITHFRIKLEVLIVAYKVPGFFSSLISYLSSVWLHDCHICQPSVVLRTFAFARMTHSSPSFSHQSAGQPGLAYMATQQIFERKKRKHTRPVQAQPGNWPLVMSATFSSSRGRPIFE